MVANFIVHVKCKRFFVDAERIERNGEQ